MSTRKPGPPVRYYPLNPRQMALTCRKLARDMRAEAAMGEGPISLVGNGEIMLVSRAYAAWSMDQQAARWEAEANTGIPNGTDRDRIGC